MSGAANKAKSRHVYRTGAAGCGGKPGPVNAKNTGQPLPCPFCDRIFKQDGRLKEHLKNKHADEPERPIEDPSSSTGPNDSVPDPAAVQAQSSYPVKTPKNLLQEWCQKNKRPAPKFMHVEVEGGFQCRVILPDTKKRELDAILWHRNAMPSSQEAHHRAAVLALHRVMGNRRLDRILPEEYQQQWYDLDVAAAEREAKLKANLKKAKKASVPQREFQSVFMSEDNRRLVEEVLTKDGPATSMMEFNNIRDDDQHPSPVWSSLLEMGFKDTDVKSAIEEANDISSALDWLMLNVEESELPSKFAPQASKSAVRIIQRAAGYESMPSDELCGLMEYGYAYDDCLAALRETGSLELALCKLFCTALSRSFPELKFDSSTTSSGDLVALREDEMVALTSIFPEGVVVSDSLLTFDVELPPEANTKLEMEVRIPTDCLYPFEIPVIGFRGKDMDSAYLQDVTRKVAERGLQLLGMPMIYDLVSYAAEASAQLLLKHAEEEVPPLLSGKEASGPLESGSYTETALAGLLPIPSSQSNKQPWQPSRNRQGRTAGHLDRERIALENLRLKEQWENLQNSPKYADSLAARRRLPAYKKRSDLLKGINSSVVSIVCGETGCGKSTQVPQYVLEESIEMGKGGSCSVICTQPRRISAIGLADRVAKERNDALGRMVGYSVRLDSCCSQYTRLLYCTTGIVLRRLLSDPELQGVTHVIVDEVHERTLESDLLLLLLKNHIKRTGGSVRVILMSATVDASTFASYFQQDLGCCPSVLHIPGFTFPVRELYLEDVLEVTGYKVARSSRHALKKKQKDAGSSLSSSADMDSWESRIQEQHWETDATIKYSEATKRSLDVVDESIINYELIEMLICTVFELEVETSAVYGPLTPVDETASSYTYRKSDLQKAGSVLVFLPGVMEIKKLQTRLQSSRQLAACGVESRWVLALHGSLSGEEQKRVFLRPPTGVRKVVLATNVAETSITIDDILYVIDTGRHKEMSYDHVKGLSCLQETWTSKSSSKQRRGRAGRVQPGCCLRLFSRKQFQTFEDQQLPEVLRVSLEGLCLKVKSLLQCSVESALSGMPTSPDSEAVCTALQALKDINAFDDNENLTPLGEHLAQMPVDARVGKMLIFGCMLKCLDPVLTIAAAMSGRPAFVSPSDKRDEASIAKQRLSGTSKSDHLAVVAAYEGWSAARRDGWSAENDFCGSNFLSREALVGIEGSRLDYLNVLKDLGFVSADHASHDTSSSSIRVIKAVVCAGFYPKVARIRHPEKTYVQTEGGTVPKLAEAHEVHYFTKSDGRVFLHPSSVNFRVGHFESPWLVVTEKVKTSKVFLRECSTVPAYSLLLFGGRITVRHEKQMILVDGWLEFEAPARIAVLIKELRRKVDSLLLEKIQNPALDISASPIVSVLLRLLENDGF